MKALVFKGPRRIELEDLPKPEVQAGHVLIAVRTCGICGSDFHGYLHGGPGRVAPMVMGHEFAGEVEATGLGVMRCRVGDQVTVQPLLYCGECSYCREGRNNLCDQKRLYGVRDLNGAMAQYISVQEKQVYGLPAGLSLAHAAMLEPVAVALEAVQRAGPVTDRTALVVGAGPIGLLILQVLKALGAGRVYVTDLNTRRLELATRLGADDVFSPWAHDPAPWVQQRTGGQGADLALEAVGLSATVQTAMACLRKGGRCVWVGNAEPMIQINMKDVVLRELEVLGTYAYTDRTFVRALELVGGRRLELDALISRTLPLEQGAAGFEALEKEAGELVKVILTAD